MASFNKITIVGYLGRDPELRYTPQGIAVCDFSIATTERKKDSSGELQDHTTWFRVTFWRNQAELASQYLTKGNRCTWKVACPSVNTTIGTGTCGSASKFRAQTCVSLAPTGLTAVLLLL